MRSRTRSLRFKLTCWFVLVFFVIQTALAAGVVLWQQEELQRSRDDVLVASSEGLIDNVLVARPELAGADLEVLVPDGAGFVMYCVRDDGGTVLASSNVASGEEFPFSSWEAVPSGKLGAVFTTLKSEQAGELGATERLRLITVPFRYGDRSYFFQAAVTDRAFEGPFFDLIIVAGPVGIIAAMIAAWLIAGRAVAPMGRLSLAARDVSPTSLGQRFRVRTNDQEVSHLEEELNLALERIEAGYHAQDHFISNVSHELKTPIAVLLTEAQVAKIGSSSEKASVAFVDHVESEMKRLGKLVESLLTLARADVLRDRPLEMVSVNDIVLQSVQHCTLVAKQYQARLIPQLAESEGSAPEAVVEGDAGLLQTMLDNLVRNAIAQSPAGGPVAIDARCTESTLELTVSDHGPGIPAAYLDKVFDRFVQVPNQSGKKGREGMGLGLAIANGVAELHHGSISVHNNETLGCSFVVTLPLSFSA